MEQHQQPDEQRDQQIGQQQQNQEEMEEQGRRQPQHLEGQYERQTSEGSQVGLFQYLKFSSSNDSDNHNRISSRNNNNKEGSHVLGNRVEVAMKIAAPSDASVVSIGSAATWSSAMQSPAPDMQQARSMNVRTSGKEKRDLAASLSKLLSTATASTEPSCDSSLLSFQTPVSTLSALSVHSPSSRPVSPFDEPALSSNSTRVSDMEMEMEAQQSRDRKRGQGRRRGQSRERPRGHRRSQGKKQKRSSDDRSSKRSKEAAMSNDVMSVPRKRTVHFPEDIVQVRYIPNLKDISAEEKADVWLTASDHEQIRRDIVAVLEDIMASRNNSGASSSNSGNSHRSKSTRNQPWNNYTQNNANIGRSHQQSSKSTSSSIPPSAAFKTCHRDMLRGLEAQIPELCYGHRALIAEAQEAVLEEQMIQRGCHYCDDQAIATVYSTFSRSAQDVAQLIAVRDAMACRETFTKPTTRRTRTQSRARGRISGRRTRDSSVPSSASLSSSASSVGSSTTDASSTYKRHRHQHHHHRNHHHHRVIKTNGANCIDRVQHSRRSKNAGAHVSSSANSSSSSSSSRAASLRSPIAADAAAEASKRKHQRRQRSQQPSRSQASARTTATTSLSPTRKPAAAASALDAVVSRHVSLSPTPTKRRHKTHRHRARQQRFISSSLATPEKSSSSSAASNSSSSSLTSMSLDRAMN